MWPKCAYGGSTLSGFPVGVLMVKTTHPILPGNVQHAESFLSPVIYEEVPISDVYTLMRGEDDLLAPIQAAAKRLAAQGVRAIAGACGSFAYYQVPVATALNVPVFLSVMSQVPFYPAVVGSKQEAVYRVQWHRTSTHEFLSSAELWTLQVS